MSEGNFFSEQGGVEDFELPGDEEAVARLRAAQEGEAVVEEPSVEPEPEAAPEPETEPEPEPEGEPAPVAEELILGKFKTQEEANAAYLELEKHAGSLRNELGERRATEAQLAEQLAAIEQHVSQPRAQITPITQDDIDTNSAFATQTAWAQGDEARTAAALAVWMEEDPGRAGIWVMTQQMEARERAVRAEMDQRLAQYDERLGPLTAQAESQGLQAGVIALATKYPDLREFVASGRLAELAEQFPLAREALASEDTDQVVSGLETLHLIDRGRVSDNLQDVSREVARAAAEEGQAVREEAFVASAAATAGAVTPSLADKYAEGWDDTDKVFESGWKVDGLGPKG